MNWNQMFLGGAVLGVLASAWSQIKAVFFWVVGLLIRRVEIHTEEAHQAIIAYLIEHYKRSRNYESMYGADHVHQRNGRYGLVPYEQYGNRTLIFWNGWFPFLYANEIERKAKSSATKNQDSDSATKIFSTITFLAARWMSKRSCVPPAPTRIGSPGRSRALRRKRKTVSSFTTFPRGRTTTIAAARGAMAWPGISRNITASSPTNRTSSARLRRMTAAPSAT